MQQPSDFDPSLETMRLQIHQAMIEHDMLAQALRAQCLISAAFVLVLGLCFLWVLRRNFVLSQTLIEQQRRHFFENGEREKRHSNEWIEAQKQRALELESTLRMQWREFKEAMLGKPGGSL